MDNPITQTNGNALIQALAGTEFGTLDIKEIDNKLWFPAIESAKKLGYSNPRDAIRRHCDDKSMVIAEYVTTGKHKDGTDTIQLVNKKYITEGDFYSLVFGSRLPIAERFRDWVCDDVLPTIRKYGVYIAPHLRPFCEDFNKAMIDYMREQYGDTERTDQAIALYKEYFMKEKPADTPMSCSSTGN